MMNAGDLLLRQVYPSWLEDDDGPSSQAFHPWRDIDDGCLSVDRASISSPEAAFTLFTSPPPKGFGQESAGVWGLTVGEIQSVGIGAWEDPVEATDTRPANPAHALLEFGGVEKKRWKSIGRQLKVKARARQAIFTVITEKACTRSLR